MTWKYAAVFTRQEDYLPWEFIGLERYNTKTKRIGVFDRDETTDEDNLLFIYRGDYDISDWSDPEIDDETIGIWNKDGNPYSGNINNSLAAIPIDESLAVMLVEL